MTFIRTKKRKTSNGDCTCTYAYLVENSWSNEKRQSKQKVREYLGKVRRPDKNEISFLEYKGIAGTEEYAENSFGKIVQDLVEWELHQHGAKDAKINFDLLTVREAEGKSMVLQMNDGFLCDYTLSRIFAVEKHNGTEQEISYMLAKALIESGIAVPKEIFVALYEKTPKRKEEYD
jgi:hypothetical protein